MANYLIAGMYGRITPVTLCLLRKHQRTYRKNIAGLSAQQSFRKNSKHPEEAVAWDQCLPKGWEEEEIKMAWIRSVAGLQAVSFVSWCCWIALRVDYDEIDGSSQENGPPSAGKWHQNP